MRRTRSKFSDASLRFSVKMIIAHAPLPVAPESEQGLLPEQGENRRTAHRLLAILGCATIGLARGPDMTHVVAQLFGWCLLAWLGALALIIAYRILNGDIVLYGLLSAEGQRFDPERVQSFAVFAFVIGGYLINALYADTPHNTLPDIPESLLLLLAGSNSLFLAGKIARTEIRNGRPPRKTKPVVRSRRREPS